MKSDESTHETGDVTVQILIIEDEIIIAQDIASKIKKLGYAVAGIISSSEKAIDFLSFKTPDLVLCDIRIKGSMDGIEVAEFLKAKKRIPFIFLTSLSDKITLDRAKKTLPYGYIVKPFNASDLHSAIEMALYKHATELNATSISKDKIDGLCHEPMTDKEYDILLDVIKGLSNMQLAESHQISVNTIKYHMRNIVTKLEVNNRADAMHRIIAMLTDSS